MTYVLVSNHGLGGRRCAQYRRVAGQPECGSGRHDDECGQRGAMGGGGGTGGHGTPPGGTDGGPGNIGADGLDGHTI